MTNRREDGIVAVHRWFATGEGWAAHPRFDRRVRALADALADPLRSRGEFVAVGLGGFLVGETVADPDCPDPKARDRHASVTRVVLLGEDPVGHRRREIMKKLRELPLPQLPGPDARLILPGFDPPPEPAPRASSGLIWAGAAGAILLCAGVILWAALRPGAHANGVTPKPPPSEAKKPPENGPDRAAAGDADLTPVDGELPYLVDRTRGEFRRKWEPVKMYDHPYVAYLNAFADRLPESAPKCRTPEDVRDGLRRLLERLNPGGDASQLSAAQLRERIDDSLSYDSWRQRAGRRAYADGDKPLAEPLRRFVEQLRRPDAELRDAAARMAEALQRWGGRDADAGRRPLTVIDHFLAALVRPVGLPNLAKLDHPAVAFLARLPADPAADGRTFDAGDDLGLALCHLLYLLDRDFNPHASRLSPRDLVERIVAQMRYADWLKAHARETFRDADSPLPPETERAARRFGAVNARE